MEISQRRFRQLVHEVDEVHRDGMSTIGRDLAALHSTRRRVLRGIGAGGLTFTIGAAVLPWRRLVAPVWADQATDDRNLAKFAESVELAAVAGYQAAVTSGKLKTPALAAAAQTFAGHHQDHAKAFGALAGDAGSATPNPGVLAAVSGQIKAAPDESAVLSVAYDLENAAASTYLFALGVLGDVTALKATASILPVESQHAVVLGTALGKQLKDMVPSFQTPDLKIDPAKYPPAS